MLLVGVVVLISGLLGSGGALLKRWNDTLLQVGAAVLAEGLLAVLADVLLLSTGTFGT